MKKEIHNRCGELVGFVWRSEHGYGFAECTPELESFLVNHRIQLGCTLSAREVYEKGFPDGLEYRTEDHNSNLDSISKNKKFTDIVLMLLKVSDVSGEMRCDLIRAAAKSLGLL